MDNVAGQWKEALSPEWTQPFADDQAVAGLHWVDETTLAVAYRRQGVRYVVLCRSKFIFLKSSDCGILGLGKCLGRS